MNTDLMDGDGRMKIAARPGQELRGGRAVLRVEAGAMLQPQVAKASSTRVRRSVSIDGTATGNGVHAAALALVATAGGCTPIEVRLGHETSTRGAVVIGPVEITREGGGVAGVRMEIEEV